MLRALTVLTLVCAACDAGPDSTLGHLEQGLGSPQVVAHLNTTDAGYPDLVPQGFTQVGGTTFFTGNGLGAGLELWATNGVTTQLVRDVAPGPGTSFLAWPTAFNGKLLFIASDGSTGPEVWSSDGTRTGTHLVVDANTGTFGVFAPAFGSGAGVGGGVGLTPYAGAVYFPGYNGLWKTDGTAAGTGRVTGGSWLSDFNASSMVVFNGALYGGASDGVHGYEPMSYSAADGGTFLLGDISPGFQGSYPYEFTPSGNQLFFAALIYSTFNTYLWEWDGTTLRQLSQMDQAGFNPAQEIFPFNGGALFRGLDPSKRYQLFKSDGSVAGSGVVLAINPTGSSFPNSFVAFGTSVLFLATDGVTGMQIWKTDGTAVGTTRVSTGVPITFNMAAGQLVPFNGGVYFCGTDNALWTSNGTSVGTVKVASFDSCGIPFAASSTQLLFHATRGTSRGLWSSDGTTNGTTLLYALPAVYDSTGSELGAVHGGVAFSGNNGRGAAQPWFSDGTAAGTIALSDAGDWPTGFASTPRGVFFVGTPPNPSFHQLTVTDGTVAGTRPISNFSSTAVDTFTPVDAGALFSAENALYFSDGTDAGTVKLLNGYFREVTPLQNVTLFSGGNGDLWSTDNTPAGTYRANVTSSNGPLYNVGGFTRVGAFAYVTGADVQFMNDSFWKTDGTAAGTSKLSITGGPGVALGNRLVFGGNDVPHGNEPWITDGTVSTMLGDLVPGTNGSSPSGFTPSGAFVFFSATDNVHGFELWVTDGTPAGTRMLRDLLPGPTGSLPHAIVAAPGGGVYFVASDGTVGDELWYSDGIGIVLVQDFSPGPASSNPAGLVASGGNLFFAADDGTGRQLWVMDATLPVIDAGTPDAGAPDAGTGTFDAGEPDAGAGMPDAGTPDAGTPDSGVVIVDAGLPDSGLPDAGMPFDDAGMPVNDAGTPDAGSLPDSGTPVHDAGMTMSMPDAGGDMTTPSGCGCSSTDASALFALLGLLKLRRRR